MKPLNRPMFRYGGPIKEGVMSGIREPKKNGGLSKQFNTGLVGDERYPKTDGREHHYFFLPAMGMAALRMLAPRAIAAGVKQFGRGLATSPGAGTSVFGKGLTKMERLKNLLPSYGPKKAEIENAWERTPGVYKDMTQWWFQATGGHIRYEADGSIKHAVRGPLGAFGDVSPEFVEFWVDYLGGGLGKSVMRTVSTAKGVVNHDSDWTKAPFLRQFYGKFDKKSEARILYEFEKNMGRTLYTEKEAIKYYNYLEDYFYKGNLTAKERQQRYKRFVKAQNALILAKQ